MKKILLSLLTICSFTFLSTNIVNAEGTDQANDTTNATNDINASETSNKLADLTQEELTEIIPNIIEIDITKTEYANYLISNKDDISIDTMKNDPAINLLNKKIIAILTEKGVTDIDSDVIESYTSYYSGEGILDYAIFLINGKSIDKDITIKYTTESNYSDEDKEYVENKVKEMKFSKYEDMDAVFTVYNVGDEANANKWTINTYDFTKLLNDKSITIKTDYGMGGFGDGTPWGIGTVLYFYKNDVLYATKFVFNIGMYGTVLDNGTVVNIGKLDKEDTNYKSMSDELKKNGYKSIIGFYEATAYGKVDGKIKLSFIVDSKYNGKNVKVLHKLKSGKYETLTSTVKDGKVTVTVNELSPFMIAIDDKAPNNAQTSSMNVGLYSVLLLSSIAGIIIVSKKKIA